MAARRYDRSGWGHCLLTTLPLLLTCGCGGDPPPAEIYSAPTPGADAGEPFDWNGTFACRQVTSQYVEREPFGQSYERQSITSYYVVTLEAGETSGVVIYRQASCLTELTPVQGVTSTFQPGFYEHTPVVPYEAQVSADEIGATFALPLQIELRGVYELENVDTDPLPTDPEDPNVYDFDHDGSPGYTVFLTGAFQGWIWIVERYRFSMDGIVEDADTISGYMNAESEQSILETSSFLIPTETDIYPDEEASHNFFYMYRMPATFTCTQLLEDKDSIFTDEKS